MMKVEIYTMNEGTEYETYILKYADSDVIIKDFETIRSLERFVKKWGYELTK